MSGMMTHGPSALQSALERSKPACAGWCNFIQHRYMLSCGNLAQKPSCGLLAPLRGDLCRILHVDFGEFILWTFVNRG
jgi:hypothetical protein